MEEDAKFAKKADGLHPSIERIRAKVKEQNDEQFLAVIGRGEYRLTNEFSFLSAEENFFWTSRQQKNSLKKKILFHVNVWSFSTWSDRRADTPQRNLYPLPPRMLTLLKFYFQYSGGCFTRLPWQLTINQQCGNVPPSEGSDPSAPVCVMVHSRSWHDSCSVLVSPKTGKVQCNKGCTNWATYSMCSHTLAAAEEMGVLKEFLKWFKSKKRSPNLSATSDQGKEGRLPVYNRVLQPSFVPVSHDTIMHIHPAPVS